MNIKIKYKKLQPLLIEWHDSQLNLPIWHMRDEVEITHTLIKTMGYFFGLQDNHIILCQSYHNDQIAGVFSIPIGCIQNIFKMDIV